MTKVLYEINRVPNKTGRRPAFFATVNGLRIGNINFYRKWEAKSELENFRAHYGEKKISEWARK